MTTDRIEPDERETPGRRRPAADQSPADQHELAPQADQAAHEAPTTVLYPVRPRDPAPRPGTAPSRSGRIPGRGWRWYSESAQWRQGQPTPYGVTDDSDAAQATMPLPAIDLADFEASSALNRADDVPGARADHSGLAAVARGGALNLTGAMVAAVCTLLVTIIVTNKFSKPVAGAFFTAMSLFLIVEAIANLGAYNGAIYFIARMRALRAERRIPAILRATTIPVVLSSLAAAAGLVAFAGPLAALLLGGSTPQLSLATVAAAVRAMAVTLPFAALADTMLGASRGYREMRPTVIVDRIGRSLAQLVGVCAAVLAASAALLAPLWAVPYIPASVIAVLWFRRIRQRHHRAALAAARRAESPGTAEDPAAADPEAMDNRHGKPNARGFWRFTAPRSLASVAQIIIQRLDIVLVAHFLDLGSAAAYTAATRFLVAGQLGNQAISMAAQPQFTHLFAVRDRKGANAVYQVTTGWLILLTWPLYLLAVVFAPVIPAIFGHSYRAHSTVMVIVILGLTMLVATACGQVDMVLITTGRSSWSLINGLLAMTVNVGVDLALIPRLGITGAAIGWAAAIALTNLMPLVQVAVAARVHPFGRGTAAACLLTAVSFGLIPLGLHEFALRELAHDSAGGAGPAVSIAVPVAAGCVVMAVGLWAMRRVLRLSLMPGLGWLRRRDAEPPPAPAVPPGPPAAVVRPDRPDDRGASRGAAAAVHDPG